MPNNFASDYVEVSERIAEFYERFPNGSLACDPPQFVEADGQQWVILRAKAYREPDDPAPGVGTAWEVIPGRTPYTKGSEVMVGETSAWGRALAALGIATKRGVASADEVRAAKSRAAVPVPEFLVEAVRLADEDGLRQVWEQHQGEPYAAALSELIRKQLEDKS